MKIIVGLGNFGEKYEGTRHNAGFMFVDSLASHKEFISANQALEFSLEKKYEAEIVETVANGEKIILVKPQTYMNASGRAVQKIMQYYKAGPKDLIVVSDDIDLPIGTIRVRQDGSSGGQRGLEDVIKSIGYDNFIRFRIGITQSGEKPDKIETANYVLDRFSKRELPVIEKVISLAVDYLLEHLRKKCVIPNHTLEVIPKEESPKI